MFKNLKLNSKIAELIGMHIGDGTLYKTTRGNVWELRGNLNEKDYYYTNVKPLLESIFNNLVFNPKFRSGGKNGCFGIQTSKKEVTNFFIEFGFKPGSKTYTVRIPDYIKNANNNIKLAFIRGLFDTDGGIRFDRINNQKLHAYPRVEFGFASKLLRDDLFELTKGLGYRSFIWGGKYFKLAIGGKEHIDKWFNEVLPNNKKHLNKYEFWSIRGYYAPRSHSPAIAVISEQKL